MLTDTQTAIDINDPKLNKIKQDWLDKLWELLFSGEETGLMSPGQIRRQQRDRVAVRKREMSAILMAEQDVNLIHQGLKCIDQFGNLIDTPAIDEYSTHSIIETNFSDSLDDVGNDGSASMLKYVAREVGIRDLERALNLRKIVLLAETEIYAAAEQVISQGAVSAEWLISWKNSAQDIFNPEVQLILAKILIAEVAQPGSYSMQCLNTLKLLSPDDLEMLTILSKFSFGSFVFNASKGYFDSELYINLLENMDELGLISGYGMSTTSKHISSVKTDSFECILRCGSKALRVEHSNGQKSLALPAYKVSKSGRQLMSLLNSVPDLAYLYEVAEHIKGQGFRVSLGNWVADNVSAPYFVEKMPL